MEETCFGTGYHDRWDLEKPLIVIYPFIRGLNFLMRANPKTKEKRIGHRSTRINTDKTRSLVSQANDRVQVRRAIGGVVAEEQAHPDGHGYAREDPEWRHRRGDRCERAGGEGDHAADQD